MIIGRFQRGDLRVEEKIFSGVGEGMDGVGPTWVVGIGRGI